MIRLSVDFEFPSREWWDAGGSELWDGLAEGFDGSSLLVDDDLAASWLAQAQAIPGWSAGPDYAPHPVRATPVDEDDEELA
jgi:hypothetical protein